MCDKKNELSQQKQPKMYYFTKIISKNRYYILHSSSWNFAFFTEYFTVIIAVEEYVLRCEDIYPCVVKAKHIFGLLS